MQKRILLIVFLVAFSTTLKAQGYGETNEYLTLNERVDLGAYGGLAFYIGDFNESNLFYQPSPQGGVLFRYATSRFMAFRGQLGLGQIRGDSFDFSGGLPGFPANQGIQFQRPVIMFDALYEFNFLPFDPRKRDGSESFSPYLVLGIGVLFTGTNNLDNPYLEQAAIQYPELYGAPGLAFPKQATVTIPMGFGFKIRPARRLTLSLEWIFKKTFNDNLDGFVNRGHGELNVFNDDWVSTLSLGLSYRMPISKKCKAYGREYTPGAPIQGYTPKMEKKKSGSKKPKNPIKQPNN